MQEFIKRGLKAGQIWRLLPRHDVYLFAPKGGGERFARLFVETWRRLPYYARRRILRLWKTESPDIWALEPKIELLSDWSGRGEEPGLRGFKAAAGGLGHMLVFWTKIVYVYPDELVNDLIAHELAHVLQWANGWNIDEADPISCEWEADVLVETWGFSSTDMDDWDRAHGVTEVIDFAKLDEGERAKAIRQQWDLAMKHGR